MSTTGSEDWQSTSCVLCATNCGLQVRVDDNRITKVRADKTNPFSRGYTCRKALTVGKYADHKQRVTTPLKRMPDGSLAAVSWEQAISEIAAKLREIINRDSPRAVALVGGGGQANHLDYLYASGFLKLLGSPWHFNALAQEFTQKYWIHGLMFGSEALDYGSSLATSEVFIAIGSNPWMSAGFQRTRDLVKEISKDEGRSLIVVDALGDSRKATDKARHLRREINKHVVLLARVVGSGDDDRRRARIDLSQASMGQETWVAKGPEQSIHVLSLLFRHRVDQHSMILSPGFFADPAGELITVT